MQAQNILHFWFEALTPEQHFVKDAVALVSSAAELVFLAEPDSSL